MEGKTVSDYTLNTKCVQAGYTPGNGEPRQIPIIQSTTFKYDTTEEMGRLFALEEDGYFYSRLQNPTREQLEKVVASLENGIDAIAFSTGMAAITMMMELFKPGDHLIVDSDLYGGSIRLFHNVSAKNGIEFSSVDCYTPTSRSRG